MAFEMDFVSDVTAILRARLTALGYQFRGAVTDEGVRFRYFNLQHRLISRRPRTVRRANGFTCPPAVQDGLTLVEGKITRGEDLRPHLSRGLTNIDYSDGLLNDWGIYHFHLGTTLDADGFIKRSGPLLFARITEDDVCFIDVRAHGAWTSLSLLQTVHANWPDSLERFRLRGVVGLAYPPGEGPPTDAQISQLRRANVNVLHELSPSQVYAPAGGGYATSGMSINVVRVNDALVRSLRDTEDAVRQFEDQFRNQLKREDSTDLPDPVQVKLVRRGNGDLVARVLNIGEMTVGNFVLL
jgi:hypothetical protein